MTKELTDTLSVLIEGINFAFENMARSFGETAETMRLFIMTEEEEIALILFDGESE